MLLIAAAMPIEGAAAASGIARAPAPVRLIVGGIGPAAARRAAASALGSGAAAVLSAGVAGSLDPDLPCPAIVLPERLTGPGPGEESAPDQALIEQTRAALEDAGLDAFGGAGLTADHVVNDQAEKREALAAGNRIVQMEDSEWARACAAAGVPFAAIRVVLDEVGDCIPPEVLGWGLDPPPARIAADILRRPPLLPELLRLRVRRRAALAELAAALRAVVPAISAEYG